MPNTTRPWKVEDIAKLKIWPGGKPTAEIAADLGRSVGATSAKAHHLKLSLKVPRGGVRRRLHSKHEPAILG